LSAKYYCNRRGFDVSRQQLKPIVLSLLQSCFKQLTMVQPPEDGVMEQALQFMEEDRVVEAEKLFAR
jgi:hypothetical protein